jgi:hypothetical protein
MHAEHKGTYLLVTYLELTHDIRSAGKVSDYVGLIWKGNVVHVDAELGIDPDHLFMAGRCRRRWRSRSVPWFPRSRYCCLG